MPDDTFTKDELAAHRAEAARGIIPSFEVIAKFIRSIRKSYSALPSEKTTKSRDKKPEPPKDVDFF